MEMGKQGVYGEVNPIEQQYSDTCAIKSQQLILQDFGIEVTEDDLVAWSAEHGLYTGNGTRMSDVGILLQEGGIPVTGKVDATVFDLVSELSQGHKVIVGVDSGELWDQGLKADLKEWWEDLRHGDTGADHALIVAGVDNSDPSNPMVLLTDPGMGDLCKRYPLDQFMDAWKDSSCFMVSTDIAPAEFASVQTANGQPAMHLADVAGNSYADFQLFHDVSQALPDMQGWDPSRGAHPISSLTQAYLDYARTDDLARLLDEGQYDFMTQVDPSQFISNYASTYMQNDMFSHSGIADFVHGDATADYLSDYFQSQASNFEAMGDLRMADFYGQQAHYMEFCQAFGINPEDAYGMDMGWNADPGMGFPQG